MGGRCRLWICRYPGPKCNPLCWEYIEVWTAGLSPVCNKCTCHGHSGRHIANHKFAKHSSKYSGYEFCDGYLCINFLFFLPWDSWQTDKFPFSTWLVVIIEGWWWIGTIVMNQLYRSCGFMASFAPQMCPLSYDISICYILDGFYITLLGNRFSPFIMILLIMAEAFESYVYLIFIYP